MFQARFALLFSASALLASAAPTPGSGRFSGSGTPFGATCWGSNQQLNQGSGCGVYTAGSSGFQQYTSDGVSGAWSGSPLSSGSYPANEGSPMTACNTNDYGTSEIAFYYVMQNGQLGFASNRVNNFGTAPMTALNGAFTVPAGSTVTYMTSATWSEPTSTTGFRNGMVVWWTDQSGTVYQFRRKTDLTWTSDGEIPGVRTTEPFVVTMNGRAATLSTSDGQVFTTSDLTSGGWTPNHGMGGHLNSFSGSFSAVNPSETYFTEVSGSGTLEVASREPREFRPIGHSQFSPYTATSVYNAGGFAMVNVFSMSGSTVESTVSRNGHWSPAESVMGSGF